MYRGPREIADAYRDDGVARRYVDERFREPIGALLHSRQARALGRRISAEKMARVLEIAPGPARLTIEAAALLESGTVLDASAQMLAEARRRLGPRGERWRFVQGDAFALPFRAEFDFVYTFRLIRHFEAADRARLYAEIARVLRPGGALMFDAVNETVSAPLRARAAPGAYAHYDALLTEGALREELGTAGFREIALDGVQHRYGFLHKLQVLVAPRSRPLARLCMEAADRTGGAPLEWIVTCRRG